MAKKALNDKTLEQVLAEIVLILGVVASYFKIQKKYKK